MTRRTESGGIGATIAVILVAVAAGIAPLPAASVEKYYSLRIYPALQHVVTPVANLVPIAILDVAVLLLLALFVARFVRAGRGRKGFRAVAILLLKTTAVVYVVFLVMWGLNYRRVPIEQKLDFDRTRITEPRAFELAAESVRRLNALHRPAHAVATTHGGVDRAALESSFADGLRALGSGRSPSTGRPKQSLLGYYFRYAAIDGMTDPIFLEIILNPDLHTFEQPEVLAHEWAHLAGYADESEANFVAWLTTLRGDALAQYSGWLSAYSRATAVLSKARRGELPPLDDGPRRDLSAIVARYRASSPLVREAARDVYDSYLKANRIEEGIANYDLVLQLMLGTTLGSTWPPR